MSASMVGVLVLFRTLVTPGVKQKLWLTEVRDNSSTRLMNELIKSRLSVADYLISGGQLNTDGTYFHRTTKKH